MKNAVKSLIPMTMAMTNIMAQEVPVEFEKYLAFFQDGIAIPENYHLQQAKKVVVNYRDAVLFRYEKDKNNGSTGEHFSFVISEEPLAILGFTFMDRRYSNTNLPTGTETKKVARDFLKKIDAGLNQELENLWIKRHDESVSLAGGRSVIAGMKYKCYRSSHDDYAWVIVGFDGSIVTYERDIKWNTKEQKRITEKWLHDSWLNEQEFK